jgi:hypothetical protein
MPLAQCEPWKKKNSFSKIVIFYLFSYYAKKKKNEDNYKFQHFELESEQWSSPASLLLRGVLEQKLNL